MSDANTNEFSGDWIWVRAGENSEGNRVAIYEEDARHPDGEAFVYGDNVCQVYPTEEVVLRLREGFLKEERSYRAPDRVAQARQEREETQPGNAPASFTGTPNATADGQSQTMDNSHQQPTETAAQRKAREKREAEGNS